MQSSTQALEVWPESARLDAWLEPVVKIATFDDTAAFHPGLIGKVLELERDPRFTKSYAGAIGSSKVFDLDRWGCAEAELIHERAIALFKRALGAKSAAVDLSWASVYRHGDYCMPHSHRRALASIVYFVDAGGAPESGFGSGSFCFADPRLKVCCQDEPGRVTTPCGPRLKEGTMIIFPGQLVHFVDRFLGPGIRITLSWNVNESPMAGPAPR